MTIGNRLRQVLNRKKWSTYDAARELGVSQPQIHRMLNDVQTTRFEYVIAFLDRLQKIEAEH